MKYKSCPSQLLRRTIILLRLAGSYSYGTNNENSDIDVPGVMLNHKSDLMDMRMRSLEDYKMH